MKLHTDPDAFTEFVNATASQLSIPAVYVEKDYWVTKALRRLNESEYREDIVFKGGTALSKAQRLIQRFSEDIDLAVRAKDLGDSRRKKLIKAVEGTVAQDLQYVEDHPMESKGSRFRKTAHAYPIFTDASQLGQVSDTVIVEINAFADPEPAQLRQISSLIQEFLDRSDKSAFIDKFELQPFEIWVLDVERTLCEKIMGLVRACHEDNPEAAFVDRIRHFYDLVMILREEGYRAFLAGDDFTKMIKTVQSWDRLSMPGAAQWLDPPLNDASVFTDPSSIWTRIESEFQGSFKDMVYGGSLPPSDEVVETLGLIGAALIRPPSE